jgi:bifunctional non-homologous end joining protein LigD
MSRRDASVQPTRRRSPVVTSSVAGIPLSNAGRVMYPAERLTKLDLARYYEAVAPRMVPHVADLSCDQRLTPQMVAAVGLL